MTTHDLVTEMQNEGKALRGSIEHLTQYGQRNRKLIRITIISLVFDILLSCGLGYVALKSRETAARAAALTATAKFNARNIQAACIAQNATNRKELQLWAHILEITPRPKTQEQVQATEDFKKYITSTFALKDCNKLKIP